MSKWWGFLYTSVRRHCQDSICSAKTKLVPYLHSFRKVKSWRLDSNAIVSTRFCPHPSMVMTINEWTVVRNVAFVEYRCFCVVVFLNIFETSPTNGGFFLVYKSEFSIDSIQPCPISVWLWFRFTLALFALHTYTNRSSLHILAVSFQQLVYWSISYYAEQRFSLYFNVSLNSEVKHVPVTFQYKTAFSLLMIT